MNIIRTKIELEEVEAEFGYTEETLNDISVVRVSLVKDVHYEAFDLTVEIYGKGDPDTNDPICDFYIAANTLATEDEMSAHGVDRQKLPLLFDDDLLGFMKERDIRLVWNAGDETEETIDLSFPGSGYLTAMER